MSDFKQIARIIYEPIVGLLVLPILPFRLVLILLAYAYIALAQIGNITLAHLGLVERREYFDPM